MQRDGQRVKHCPVPTALYFADNGTIPRKVQDAFIVVGSLLIVSAKLEAIISEFASDCTEFFEVPIHADQNGSPTDLPNHFVFNVFGTKDALIPELSENIEKPIHIGLGETEPRPGAKWRPTNDLDVVALDASAIEGCDVWTDPEYTRTIFFSDRLKKAIDTAGLKTHALGFKPVRVFNRG